MVTAYFSKIFFLVNQFTSYVNCSWSVLYKLSFNNFVSKFPHSNFLLNFFLVLKVWDGYGDVGVGGRGGGEGRKNKGCSVANV